MLKKLSIISGTLALVAASLMLAVLITPAKNASAHIGNATFDCAKGVQFNFSLFADAPNNQVHVTASVNGMKKLDTTLVWNGPSYVSDWFSLGSTDGKTTFRATGDWNTNGHKGSFDTGDQPLDCSHPCQPVTVTIIQTVPGPTTTVHDTQTVTNTETVTVAGPTQTVTNNITTPAATVTVQKTVTVKSPPKIIVKTKIKKVYVKVKERPHHRKVKVVPRITLGARR